MNEAVRFDRALAPKAIAAHVLRSGGHRPAVAALARRALAGDAAAGSAFFGGVVEPLCDAFSPRPARLCDAVLAQVIHQARRTPQGGALDAALAQEGVASEADLLERTRWGLSAPPPAIGPVRRVIVLSRVTLGADVAVNGALLPGLRARFPEAEAVFLGPEIARPFAEGLGARFVAAGYVRRGDLMARLSAWIPLRDAIRAEAAGLGCGEWLLIDPDTRLTQLGLLAPGPEHAYRRLRSREEQGPGTLTEIARAWVRRTLGAEVPPPVPLPLRPGDAAWSRRLRAALARAGSPVVAAGFGTGGNSAKRVGPRFEAGMLCALLARGVRVLLARGVDAAERAATRDLCAALEASGARVAHLREGRHADGMDGADVVTWAADAGAFLAAVAACDAHLGYDSAGGHVAAALGVPSLTAFVEAAGPRHVRRWTPSGPAPVHVVRIAPGTPEDAALRNCRAGIDAVLRAATVAPPPRRLPMGQGSGLAGKPSRGGRPRTPTEKP